MKIVDFECPLSAKSGRSWLPKYVLFFRGNGSALGLIFFQDSINIALEGAAG
jgi:hypothetical protein